MLSLNAVPNPSSEISETSVALKDFEEVSKYAKAAIEALVQSAEKLADLKNNIKAAKERLNAVQNLEAKSEKLLDKTEGEFHADFSAVIEAVSMGYMFANHESGEEYLTQLRVDAQKFDAIAESYVPKGEDSDAVKAALKKLVETVQTKNNLIQDTMSVMLSRGHQSAD
ncbi:hypothetical protein SLS59_008554 [Nothophoma quercina]|uniref:Uncharacterized protein n=1 Tax=Nothophoma quercina TaxID=749835 RepID=A0ABR3QSE1_9PLEO